MEYNFLLYLCPRQRKCEFCENIEIKILNGENPWNELKIFRRENSEAEPDVRSGYLYNCITECEYCRIDNIEKELQNGIEKGFLSKRGCNIKG